MSVDRRKKSWKLQSSDYPLMILHQLLRRTLVPVIVGLGLWTTVKSVPAVEYATDPKCIRAGARKGLS
ncbi:hypothetical protein CSPX01_01038 [Colletotrichum filicis]|nr:hypothetical protein CSPX01_01038 [Colletotrichum filicis]